MLLFLLFNSNNPRGREIIPQKMMITTVMMMMMMMMMMMIIIAAVVKRPEIDYFIHCRRMAF